METYGKCSGVQGGCHDCRPLGAEVFFLWIKVPRRFATESSGLVCKGYFIVEFVRRISAGFQFTVSLLQECFDNYGVKGLVICSCCRAFQRKRFQVYLG